MKYNDPTTLGGVSQFNGNISEALWTSVGNNKQSYAYSYDPLNRLKQAKYFDRINPLNNDKFNEIITRYDNNGNIGGLQRGKGNNLMDDLKYTYVGNRLYNVGETGSKEDGFIEGDNTDDDYDFDANGNMRQDKNKGIGEITYNYLNLTENVTKSATDNIQYVYNAAGLKLSQIVNEDGKPRKTIDYVGGFVYENGVLQFFFHDEGRVDVAKGNTYEYFLKDHLGNVRTMFTTVQETESHTATMEDEDLEEDKVFINFGNTRIPTIDGINSTPLAKTGQVPEVVRLNGRYNNLKQGPGKSIAVFPGDKITARVNVKYLDLRRDNAIPPSALLNYFATGVGGFSTSEIGSGLFQITSSSDASLSAIIGSGTESDYAPPHAYLNFLFFDKYKNSVIAKTVLSRVDETAAITPLTIKNPHQVLSFEVEITEPGFVYVNVSHDADEDIDVYFDDLYVEHQKGFIVQQQDYFAFGMEFNNVIQDGVPAQKYLYNSKEKQDLTGWLDYGARMYMADVGRFLVQDALADFGTDWSPYRYAFDNPVNIIDRDGHYEINVTLSEEEEKQLKEIKDKNQRRAAREKLIESKKQVVRDFVAAAKSVLDKNPEIKAIFAGFSGIKEGSREWDNLWSENGKGPKLVSDGKLGKSAESGWAMAGRIGFNPNNEQGQNVLSVLHEYVHYGDDIRALNGQTSYENTFEGVPGYDSQIQRDALDEAFKRASNDPDPQRRVTEQQWSGKGGYYESYYRNGKVSGVELGYGFEKQAFGAPYATKQDYLEFVVKYLNKK